MLALPDMTVFSSRHGREPGPPIDAEGPGLPCFVARRPERGEDAAFRFGLFLASRSPAESLDGVAPGVAEILSKQQFAGQEATYRTAYPEGRFDIIDRDGVPAGRIVTVQSAAALRLVDIALLPAHRGNGIGTQILRALQDEARAARVPLCLSVLTSNVAALRFYVRLGFETVAAATTHLDLQWTS